MRATERGKRKGKRGRGVRVVRSPVGCVGREVGEGGGREGEQKKGLGLGKAGGPDDAKWFVSDAFRQMPHGRKRSA